MQLNVKNASVQEVLKLIAEAGNFNIAIGGGIKGSVTLFVDDMAPRDLLDVVVGVIDAAYVEENGAVWVMSKEAYATRYGEPFVDNLVSRSFQLKRAQVKEILPSLKSLLGDKAVVKPDLGRNMVRIKASPKLVAEAAQMLAEIDQPRVTKGFALTSMPSALAAGLLGKMVTDQTTIVEDPVNQRLVVSSSEFEINRVAEILRMLDVGEGLQSEVLEVSYTDPDSLAEALRPHLTLDVGQIHVDQRSRKLILMDFPPVLAHVKHLASLVDVPVRQVLIEAKILMVSTSDNVRSGINWEILQDQVNIAGRFPGLAGSVPGVTGDFGDLTAQNYQIVVEALQEYGETKLISSPRLVVMDGEAGMIHVGSQVPYKTIDTRETAAGTINQFETVVIVDVGVKLDVSVAISGIDMIRLMVHPEVSEVSGYAGDIPIVDKSTADSILMIEDGNTVILGGLMKDHTRKTRKGVPILASIPLIKYLFSSNVNEKFQSEMVILLTPRIMTGRELYEGAGVANDD